MSLSFAAETIAQSRAEGQRLQPASIAQLLTWAALEHPRTGIRIITEANDEAEPLSHPALLHEARCILGALRTYGRPPGTKVLLLLEDARDFLPAWWACVLGGYIPCPLAPIRNDPARWARHLGHVESLLERPILIVTRALRQELPDLHGVELETLRVGKPAYLLHEARTDEPAILMLTSGSTGNSKAVVLTHGNLLASMAGKAQRQQMTASDITLNWISFDHVAALLEVHLISLYVGATQFHIAPAAILTDPLLLLRLIDRYQITLTFSPNFLLGQINAVLESQEPEASSVGTQTFDLSSLRYMISGGEANVVATGERFLQGLARYGLAASALRPAFGMTETCAGSTYSEDFPACDVGNEFASVGYPVTGMQLRIAGANGVLVQPGEVGELELRGALIFQGYYNNEEATRAAFTADGWFRSGDLGCIDDGRLRLMGRSKDSIIVSGVNYFSHELEAALEQLEGIERSFVAVFPTRPSGADTEQLVIAFATSVPPEDEARLHRIAIAVRNSTIALWGFRPDLVFPLPREAFPKTSLGKIQRSLLRQRLESGKFATDIEYISSVATRQLGPYAAPQGPEETAIAQIFSKVLRVELASVSATASFFDLGGTSLDIFKLKHTLEERFTFADLSVATILQNSSVRGLATRMSSENRARHGRYNPLVPLQTTGNKVPLFCVHPGTGEVLVFVGLANHFINDRPFYALRARGFNSGEKYFGTWEEMVTTYVEAIRTCQPHGPYALAGYSFGAPVAFEIAKALEAGGEQIAFVGCIDGTPAIGDPAARLDFVGSTVIVAFFLSMIDREQMRELPEQIRSGGDDPCTRIMELTPPRRLAQLNLDLARFKAWAELAYSLVTIGEKYQPVGNINSATVFYANPLRGTKQDWLDTHLRRWDGFARASNRYIEVPGEHNSLLGPRHVAAFQAILRAELDRALGEA
jgi:acyl-CoA synthetase (AMP-forming)/AMP-acid ligase II/thioesterase domain-containing protein